MSLIAIFYAWSLAYRRRKTIWEALLWTVFWGAVGGLALFPSSLSYLSIVTGAKDQQNAAFITFIAILLFMMFYVVMRVEDLSRQNARIVRAIGLKEAGLEDGKRS